MERRFDSRLDEMMEQANVTPELLRGLLPRLTDILKPFVKSLKEPEQKQRAVEYTTGLISGLERKTGEGIAYLYDQDRQGMQKFIGQIHWDHQPLLQTLAGKAGQELGESDGVIVFDPSAFPKIGDKSVGVAMQWCGRLGKVENCQVGIYMAYVTRKEHTIVNTRLYLNEEWAKDRRRR
jgi:SRSO17 transposase